MSDKIITVKFTALVNFNASASTGSYVDEATALAKRYYQPILGPSYLVYGINFRFLRDEDYMIDDKLLMIEVTLAVQKMI